MSERPHLKLVTNFDAPPPPAGAYWIGPHGARLAFALPKRPSRWHQFWTRVLLGWHWRDYP